MRCGLGTLAVGPGLPVLVLALGDTRASASLLEGGARSLFNPGGPESSGDQLVGG